MCIANIWTSSRYRVGIMCYCSKNTPAGKTNILNLCNTHKSHMSTHMPYMCFLLLYGTLPNNSYNMRLNCKLRNCLYMPHMMYQKGSILQHTHYIQCQFRSLCMGTHTRHRNRQFFHTCRFGIRNKSLYCCMINNQFDILCMCMMWAGWHASLLHIGCSWWQSPNMRGNWRHRLYTHQQHRKSIHLHITYKKSHYCIWDSLWC